MRFLLVAFIVLPFLSPAQKIKSIGNTKSGQKVIETYALSLKETKSTVTTLRFRSVGSNYYAFISGSGLGVSTISPQDQVVFIMDNDSTVTLTSTGRQAWWYRDSGLNSYQHRYTIRRNDLEALAQGKLKAIRKSAGDDYTYISIAPRFQERAKRLSALFVKYLPKIYTTTTTAKEPMVVNTKTDAPEVKTTDGGAVTNIKAEDAAQHIGDSVTVCAKVFTARYLDRSKGKPTLLNPGCGLSQPAAYGGYI